MSESDALPVKSLLSRIRSALSARDWLGVAIELGVVIAGILIAFQISEWGENRARAREERHYLERLATEYERGIAELRDINRFHDRVIREFSAAFAARDNPALLAAYSRTLDFGCGGARFQAATFNDTAFEEMLTTGRLNLISSQRLRSEIRDLASAQSAANRQVQYGRELMLGQLPALNPHYRFNIGRDGSATCFIDWRGVLGDQLAVNAAVRAYRVHHLARDRRREVVERSQSVLNALRCELGKPECKR